MSAPEEKPAEWSGASLTEPFDFRSRLRPADSRLDFVPVLDLIVIALLVSLFFTRFVSMPGVRVDLPVTEMRMQHSQDSVAVLTIGNNGMLLFDGAVFESGTIARGFQNYMEESVRGSPVLLVKADVAMEMQEFLRLCELAKEAGFIQVQLAGKQEKEVNELLSAPMSGPGGI